MLFLKACGDITLVRYIRNRMMPKLVRTKAQRYLPMTWKKV